MRFFTLFLAFAARLAPAMRPEVNNQNRLLARRLLLKDIASLRDRLEELVEAGVEAATGWMGLAEAKSRTESMLVLAENQTDQLLVQVANATEHMDSDTEATFRSVLTIVNTTIYASMDESHATDQIILNQAAEDIEGCNADIAARLAEGGDIYGFEQKCRGFQSEIATLRGSLPELNMTNQSAWQHLFFFVKYLHQPPACPEGYEAKTPSAIGEFVGEDDYKDTLEHQKNWYTDTEADFTEKHNEWQDANAAVVNAQNKILEDKAILRTEFCVWHLILTAGCAHFDVCYQRQVEHFNEVVKTAKKNEQTRIDAYRAGEKVIAHVEFVLGQANFPEEVQVDASRYELHYPPAPAQGSCEVTDARSDPFWDDDLACDGAAPALVQEQEGPGEV